MRSGVRVAGKCISLTAADGMTQRTFFKRPSPVTLVDLAALTGAQLADEARADRLIAGAASLDRAGPAHLTFCENKKYAAQLEQTHAGACLVNEKLEGSVPPHVAVLRVAEPYKAFVAAMRALNPDTLRPTSWFDNGGVAAAAVVHPSAYLEDDVIVDPLAVIGPDVEIGAGTVIGSGAVIGAGVRIGRDCNIGANASVLCALIGNEVIIQNGVEIGAGCTIDRGALNDTVIGEGSKIDNLVQIGHNVVIGRNCVVVRQSGIAGSSTLGDGVVLAARIGVSDHATIGDGAQIAARSSVVGEVPAGARWGGSPAKPIKQFFRELFEVERLGREGIAKLKSKPSGDGEQT